jgi:hypothetical protein
MRIFQQATFEDIGETWGTYAPRTISARGEIALFAFRLQLGVTGELWSMFCLQLTWICWRWLFIFPMGYPLLGEDMCNYIYSILIGICSPIIIICIYIYISSPSSGYPLSSINGTSNGHICLLFSEGFLSKSQLYVEPTKTKRRVPRYLTSNRWVCLKIVYP